MAQRLAAEPPEDWAVRNFGGVDLGHARRSKRVVKIAACLAAAPSESIPAQMGDPHQAKAAYRFFDSRHMDPEQLTAVHRRRTMDLASGSTLVLLVQDTSELCFGVAGAREELGPVGHGAATEGLLLHTTLAIDPSGPRAQILGIGDLRIWARDGVRPDEPQHKRRVREDRESLKWEQTIQRIGKPAAGTRWVHVADREADVWETYAACLREHSDCVVRACGAAARRKALRGHGLQEPEREEGTELQALARALAPAGSVEVTLPRGATAPERTIELRVAYAPVTLLPPRLLPRTTPSMEAWMVRVWENNGRGRDKDKVEWVLITTVPVESLDDAVERVKWYRHRWIVEEYHKCLKSGCRVEERQLEAGHRLEMLACLLAVVAVRLLQLRDLGRTMPQSPASIAVGEAHVRMLAKLKSIPLEQLTCRRFCHEVAKLGGFMGRKSDGEPGWLTLWRGWVKLDLMTQGALAFLQPEGFG